MNATMQARRVPRFTGGGRIEWAQHTYPEPGDGELLVAVGANAICGTDRNEYVNGASIVPGHEAAGIVVQSGARTTVQRGTRGAIYLMDYCGTCRSCQVGATNQCLAKRADVGQTSDGGYGPYALVHESNFFPITDDISLTRATLLLDVMGTSAHALRRAELIRTDTRSVYVAGAGPIGLGLLVMCKLRLGPDFPVYVSDLSPWRREFAASFGAIPVDPSDRATTAGLEIDVAFDSTGKEAARRTALDSLTKRGVLVCVGHGEGLALNVSQDLIAPERAVLGSEYFRFDEMGDNLTLLRDNQELVGRVITHELPVEDIAEAFELFLAGRTGKVVITQDPAL